MLNAEISLKHLCGIAVRAPSTTLRSLRELRVVPLPHLRGGG
jgi:hypothetical protein